LSRYWLSNDSVSKAGSGPMICWMSTSEPAASSFSALVGCVSPARSSVILC
jgi:hypothetical protein